jgi:hypothetical protein
VAELRAALHASHAIPQRPVRDPWWIVRRL